MITINKLKEQQDMVSKITELEKVVEMKDKEIAELEKQLKPVKKKPAKKTTKKTVKEDK